MSDIFDLFAGAAPGTATLNVPGDAYMQPQENPEDARPTANIGDIAGNALKDAGQMGQGLAALPAVPMARAWEVIHGQPLFRDTDPQAVSNLLADVVQQYKQNYFDPIVQGRPQDILTYAAQHPLFFGLDVAPALKWAKVGELLGNAGKVAAATRPVQALASGARDVFDVAMQHPAMQPLAQFAFKQRLSNQLSDAMQGFLQENQQLHGELMRASDALPANERAELLSAAEATHPQVLMHGYNALTPGQQHYVELLRRVSAGTAARALKLGHLTTDNLMDAIYSPVVKPLLRHKFGIDVDFDAMNAEEKLKLRALAKQELDRVGVRPIYQARMFESEARRMLERPTEVNPGLLRTAAQRASRAAAAGEDLANKDGMRDVRLHAFEHARKADRGEQFYKDSARLAVARDVHVAQAYFAYQVLLDRILKEAKAIGELGPEHRAALDAGKLTEWHPRELFKAMTKEIAELPEDRTRFLEQVPEKVLLPTPMVKALENFGKGWGSPSGPLKMLKGVANFARRYTLGLNLLFPETQHAQNLVMLGLTQFKGPRNAMLSLCSYALAFDKRVVEHVPPGIVEEMFHAERASSSGILGKHIEGAIDKYHFGRLQKYDSYSRAVAAIQYAIEASEKVPGFKPLLSGFISSADAIERLSKVYGTPELAQPVMKQVFTVMGDYTRATAERRALLRSTLLWWMWYEHIVKYTFFLPRNNPFKAQLMAHLAQITPEALQNPDAPDYLNKSGAVPLSGMTNDQGYRYHLIASEFNPLTSSFELLEQATSPFNNSEEGTSTIFGGMNPVIQLAIAAGLHVNPATGNDFQDPNLLHQGGEQFRPDEYAQGIYNPQKPVPNWMELAGRYFFNRPVRAAERVLAKAASNGESTQFTSIMGPANDGSNAPMLQRMAAARKAINMGGEPIHAPSWPEMALQLLTGVHPIPVEPGARQMTQTIQAKRMEKGRRSAAMQGIQLQGNVTQNEYQGF